MVFSADRSANPSSITRHVCDGIKRNVKVKECRRKRHDNVIECVFPIHLDTDVAASYKMRLLLTGSSIARIFSLDVRMAATSSKRREYFTSLEKEILLGCIEKHKELLENKKTDQVTTKEKDEC